MEFKIREEEAKDIEQVREILRGAFFHLMQRANLLTKGKAIISLVAVDDD